MPANPNTTDAQSFDLQRYLAVVRRHHLHFLIPLFLGWLLVWGASWVLPKRYTSSTLILVEQPTMPKEYVVPNVTEDVQGRLQNIAQQILSRTRLLRIIKEDNLYANDNRRRNPDEIVEQMRKDIGIELQQDARKQVTGFRINYTANDAKTAQITLSALANLFIGENVEVRQRQSEDTTEFLKAQLETAQQGLAAQEEKIREYKAQHVSELPSQLPSNLQILSGLQAQLQTEQASLNTAEQQKIYLESLIREYKSARGTSQSSETGEMDLQSINDELEKMQAQLTDLRSRYNEQFPEIRSLKHKIAAMEKLREKQLAASKDAGDNAQADGKVSPAGSAVNAKTHPELFQLQSKLQANQAEISNHQQMIAALQSKISDYQARLNQEPVREQQLADLSRGYDQSKEAYDDLMKKAGQSAMATSLEKLQEGEHFHMIDPPTLPLTPSSPNRLKFCIIGIVVGAALGMGVAGLFALLDDRVYLEEQLKALLPVPVIGEIPVITSPGDETSEKRKLWFGWAAAAVVLTAILAGTTISYLAS